MSEFEGEAEDICSCWVFLTLTPSGSRPRGMVRLDVSNAGHPLVPDITHSSMGGSDASRIDRVVRGDVVDLAARGTDIH